jgi:3-isopropylmalate/(R)-2-methylmalate dehydratase large subunit
MSMTISEKILARAAGVDKVVPGEIVACKADLICIDDIQIAIFKDTLEKMGTDAIDKERTVFVADHYCPPTNLNQAKNVKLIKEFAITRGLHFLEGSIKDQLLWENGFIQPGMLVVATDSHITTCGALGTFAAAFGPSEAAIMALHDRYWFKVPESIRCEIAGELQPFVSPKDIGLYILGQRGTTFANYKAIEFCGPTVRDFSIDARVTLCNMTTEMGAKNGIVESDSVTETFLQKMGVKNCQRIFSDADAVYSENIAVDASKLEPMVASPDSPANVGVVSDVTGTKIDQGFIGSCGNGNIDDLRIAARILKGKTIHPGTRLIIAPASRGVHLQALSEGLIEIFLRTGALVSSQTCSVCAGLEAPLLPGEVCITTSPRNFKGRMGSPEAQIYLASPATVAASAIRGEISDPRKFQ